MMTKNTAVTNTLKILSDNIRQQRAALAITQEQLAELAGLSHNYVARIELGLKQPSIATLTALAGALDVEVADLFTQDRLHAEPIVRTHYLEAAMADLSPVDRDLVMKVLTMLVRRLRD